ncbi:undecaprenyldiphospho-muramoylpentapeptide beta-N-acetylglucosaminyltransferase [bacterium]|nr:undecaprenyldiphospho-muramoylpentapeptide beta-N-acetylglucosaminyltransferase [bacterium]
MSGAEKTYPPIKMIISGGGTGGHLFPAIAIAQEIKALSPQSEVLFVGAKGKIEMEKVPQYGFKIHGLWISGFNRSQMWRNVSLPFKVLSSLVKSWVIIKRFKPQIAVGVGGYASAAVLYVAGKKVIPTLLQEQNSYPGVTNKMLAAKASKICVAFPGMDKYFDKQKLIETGNPIRSNIKKLSKTEAAAKLGLKANVPTLLVVGGSLGAKTLNEAIKGSLEKIKEAEIQLIWQCGKIYVDRLKSEIGNALNERIMMTDFIADMDAAYSLADLVVSRSGALSISEITFLGKASIMVPSPNVAEDHQTKNAEVLARNGAALLVKDSEAETELVQQALKLLTDKEKLMEMESNAAALAKPHAAHLIATQIFELVK